MDKPLLSICIPTYNRAEIVYECVQDCLKIPHDWLEVVVTDNCSTDDTKNKLSQIKDPRLKYFRNEKNIGYINLSKCMANGSGEYCLLLSDEDVFVDTDWYKLKNELKNACDISIFLFNYYDQDGSKLVMPPERVYRRNVYETFIKIHYTCSFAGGIVLKREVMNHFPELNNKIPLLWSLYSQHIISLRCAMYGNCTCLENVSVKRSNRDGKGSIDTKSWCAGMNEPYWTISSRIVQYKEWIVFFSELETETDVKIRLAEDVLFRSIWVFRNYYDIVNKYCDRPLFKKYSAIIFRDRKKYKYNWIRASINFYNQVSEEFDRYFGKCNRSTIREKNKLIRMVLSFVKQYIKQGIKQLKRG